MAYTVTIEYKGVEHDAPREVAQVARIFNPNNSYIDTPAYTEGYPQGEAEQKYGKSVYATNVEGWGDIKVPEPYASTSVPFPVPLAQFKLAVVGEDNKVEFNVDDYKEAFYYKEVGDAMADQGFVVTIKNA